MEFFDFSVIAGHAIEVLTMVIMAILSWAGVWAKSKFQSDVMKTTMERLTETVKNGARYAIQQGEVELQGKLRVTKTKNMVVNMAVDYVITNSPDLIKASGYSMDKIRRMIESKLPEISANHVEDVVNVEMTDRERQTLEARTQPSGINQGQS